MAHRRGNLCATRARQPTRRAQRCCFHGLGDSCAVCRKVGSVPRAASSRVTSSIPRATGSPENRRTVRPATLGRFGQVTPCSCATRFAGGTTRLVGCLACASLFRRGAPLGDRARQPGARCSPSSGPPVPRARLRARPGGSRRAISNPLSHSPTSPGGAPASSMRGWSWPFPPQRTAESSRPLRARLKKRKKNERGLSCRLKAPLRSGVGGAIGFCRRVRWISSGGPRASGRGAASERRSPAHLETAAGAGPAPCLPRSRDYGRRKRSRRGALLSLPSPGEHLLDDLLTLLL